jgi:hypothetical protein
MITADELRFNAELEAYLDRQRAKWDAEDAKRGAPPTKHMLDERWLWEAMIEDTAWDDFYGPPL